MNIVIIEDERLTAQKLHSLIRRYDGSINLLVELSSVEESVSWFKKSADIEVDLIFMDIHLEDGDSFQIVKALDLKTPIIFTTAYDDYMVNAFKVNSIDYLLKPINYEELVAAIEKFKSLKKILNVPGESLTQIKELLDSIGKTSLNQAFKDRFMITVGTKIRAIKTSSIAYFYLEGGGVSLVTFENDVLPVDYSLEKLMQMIDPKQFFRVSRQFIVALNAIQLVHTYSAGKLKIDLKPKSTHEVFVSGDRITDFKEWLGK